MSTPSSICSARLGLRRDAPRASLVGVVRRRLRRGGPSAASAREVPADAGPKVRDGSYPSALRRACPDDDRGQRRRGDRARARRGYRRGRSRRVRQLHDAFRRLSGRVDERSVETSEMDDEENASAKAIDALAKATLCCSRRRRRAERERVRFLLLAGLLQGGSRQRAQRAPRVRGRRRGGGRLGRRGRRGCEWDSVSATRGARGDAKGGTRFVLAPPPTSSSISSAPQRGDLLEELLSRAAAPPRARPSPRATFPAPRVRPPRPGFWVAAWRAPPRRPRSASPPLFAPAPLRRRRRLSSRRTCSASAAASSSRANFAFHDSSVYASNRDLNGERGLDPRAPSRAAPPPARCGTSTRRV